MIIIITVTLPLTNVFVVYLVAHYHQKQNWYTVLTNEDSYVHFYIQLQNTWIFYETLLSLNLLEHGERGVYNWLRAKINKRTDNGEWNE